MGEVPLYPQSGAVVRRKVDQIESLVLWCFVLNPHRRSPYSKLLFCVTSLEHAGAEWGQEGGDGVPRS